MIFAFLTSSGGKFYEFFMTVALAIPPLTMKNRPCALIRACALNQKNMVHVNLTIFHDILLPVLFVEYTCTYIHVQLSLVAMYELYD